MRAVTLQASGRVQGVGFRWATKVAADKCGVNGIVRNLMDGSVFIEAEGEDQRIAVFIDVIRQSPTDFGRVDHLIMHESEPQNYHNFRITN
ncbi:acylphosphatase [Lactiplantibacillus mudanjiangensis]|uniref:acylphosphatase n=1 Tax=Lactiplantibacillus mudanjiangensis TaxID=1296538 RepID=A0A660E9K6_9LACO|nr:acylphosphatase [Lactiplantibacillus mudanjiangensis]VDG25778.1 acylphosphatase [Lactobacillus sp.] [Lactiplantibacillus mudanjiangensis]VDG29749.1 acylphosphatase [Lactobacillus sp.] [Lactiplantibacillus mudanjiangensis]